MQFPLFQKLLVELQSNCNRQCFFCNRPGDTSGKRYKNGKKVIKAMPTEQVVNILYQAKELGFTGRVAFHHMSEAFLDDRIITFARLAIKFGMTPYAHSNGDRLRKDSALSKEAAKVFGYMVIGIYDFKSPKELKDEKKFWKDRLKGTEVKFSYVGDVYPRAHTKPSVQMKKKKVFYPSGVCSRPFVRLLVHYDGGIALCCEDMEEDFNLGNAFDTPIRDIWFGEKHKQILKDLNKGKRSIYELCAKCPIKPNVRRKHIEW